MRSICVKATLLETVVERTYSEIFSDLFNQFECCLRIGSMMGSFNFVLLVEVGD